MTALSHTTNVWEPTQFRLDLEAAFTKALRKAARTARREALRANAPAAVEAHRLPATRTFELDGWYSDAPKATGEEQDVFPDEPLDSPEDAGSVAFRTQDAILDDVATVAWLHRDEAPTPRGYGMTQTEMRRQWLMNARLRYADLLREALRRHRGLSPAKANEFPALKAEAQFARSVQARWRFVDELERHGVRQPDADTVRKLKLALGGTFELAHRELVERRHAAEAGRLDRYRHELV